MPVDPEHAFADGPAFPRPSALRGLDRWRESDLAHRVRRAWACFDATSQIDGMARLGPSAWCVNSGPSERIRIGGGTVCRGLIRREHFGDGHIVIGEDVYIGDDCILSCCDRLAIGARTLLGHGVQIFDNNSHPTGGDARSADARQIFAAAGERAMIEHAPIGIGAEAWIGFGAIILKGVTIGDRAIVAAGAIVTSSVAAGTVVAGNPARVVKALA